MAEYIEREAAFNALLKLVPKVDDDGYCYAYSDYCWVIRGDAATAIDSIPAADVRPVVRGKWTRRKSKLYTMCSACGYGYSNSHYHKVEEFKFCPNCGAMMEESWLDWLKQEASE